MADIAYELEKELEGIAALTSALEESHYGEDTALSAALDHLYSAQKNASKRLHSITCFLTDKWEEARQEKEAC